jgi:hypothetical protein
MRSRNFRIRFTSGIAGAARKMYSERLYHFPLARSTPIVSIEWWYLQAAAIPKLAKLEKEWMTMQAQSELLFFST